MKGTFTDNGAVFIEDGDMIVADRRRTGEPFEARTTEWMFAVMQGGGVVVDAGASTGWYAIPLALRGCEVHAFEPHREARERLLQNMSLNGTKVRVYPVALSDKEGSAVLHYNVRIPLTSGASIDLENCLQPTGRTRVGTCPLDRLALRPKLIKVDVEGHEMAVLSGARRTIRLARPHLVLEANTDAARAALMAWLQEHGYSVERADERNLLCTPRK